MVLLWSADDLGTPNCWTAEVFWKITRADSCRLLELQVYFLLKGCVLVYLTKQR